MQKRKKKKKRWLVWNVYSRFKKEERNSVDPNLRFFQSPFLNSSHQKKCWFLNKNSTQWVNGGRFSFTVVVAHLMIVPGPCMCTSILSTEAIGLLRTNWKTLEKSGSLQTQVQLTSFYTGMMIHVFGTLLLIPQFLDMNNYRYLKKSYRYNLIMGQLALKMRKRSHFLVILLIMFILIGFTKEQNNFH